MKRIIPLAINNALLEIEKSLEGLPIIPDFIKDDNLLNLRIKHYHLTSCFRIEKYDVDSKDTRFIFRYSPGNDKEFLPSNKYVLETSSVIAHLKSWTRRIIRYQEMDTPFQDKFIKQYQEEFEQKFKVLDADADEAPFNEEKQTKLNTVLDKIVLYLEEHKTEDVENDFDEIIYEAKALQEGITTTVKSQVIKKFSSIAAKIWRLGIEVAKGAMGSALWEGAKFLLG